MKIFETTAKSAQGTELRVYFDDGKVIAEGGGKKAVVISANKYSKTLTIDIGKEVRIGMVSGVAHIEAMVRTLEKSGRELYMFDSRDDADKAGEGFGSSFESVESRDDRIACAYKYSK